MILQDCIVDPALPYSRRIQADHRWNSFGDGCASIALETAVMAANSARVGR